jgi:DNA-binding GntR family transcriptional regulator
MLPGRGYQVAPLSLASLSELFQVWRIIAPAIIDLAMQNMTPRDRAVLLDEEPARLQAAMREGDGVALVEMSADFWMRLAELAGNARLLDIYLQLLGELRRVFALVYRDADALLALNSIMGENRRLLRRSERGREGVERFVDTAFAHVLARRRLVTWRDAADPPAWLPR